MLIPSTEPSLEQIVLRLLARKPHLSAERIRVLASQGRSSYSPAAVYKVLSRLLSSGVAVRSGSQYSLSLAWVFELLTFAGDISKTYFSDEYVGTLLPAIDKKMTWKFANLGRCNEFWNQLLLALLKGTRAENIFSWVPYPWFALLQDDAESRLHQAFKMSGRTFYTSFGPSGALEPVVKKLYSHKNQIISFAKGPLHELKNSYIDVVGDYVLTVTLAPDSARSINGIFSELRTRHAVNLGKHLAVLSERCKVTVTIECNQKKAAKLRQPLQVFFGLDQGDEE